MMQSFTVQQLQLAPTGNQWEPEFDPTSINGKQMGGFAMPDMGDLVSDFQMQGGQVHGEEKQVLQSDEFKMYFYKVIPCSKRCCHDWTTCPYAHPGEKAARRDPRLYNYVAQVCADMKKAGRCESGNLCMYAHNVFEYWLHPTKYRTQLCNDEMGCRRKVCFFAHCLDELRVPAAYPRALSALDTSSGSFQLPATVRLKDALAQEATKGPQDSKQMGGVPSLSPQTPPPPPPKTINQVMYPQTAADPNVLSPSAAQVTMAKTQDLLQQLQLMQAFKDPVGGGVNVQMMDDQSAAGVAAVSAAADTNFHYNNNSHLDSRMMISTKSRSSSGSTNYSPSAISPFPSFGSDLPVPPPPPPKHAHHIMQTFNPAQFM